MAVDPVANLYRHHGGVEIMVELEEGRGGGRECGREYGREKRGREKGKEELREGGWEGGKEEKWRERGEGREKKRGGRKWHKQCQECQVSYNEHTTTGLIPRLSLPSHDSPGMRLYTSEVTLW